ncbi:uncharacterized protein FPRO_03018 [Fusarium proliferatum ET1]|uniref:Uncharacterized protein n=1 Tax=Fusarium proliferatum (strain ET1) TaxID=1227346 RepID=A0A1L7V8Z9_FUSPR|nr:uncharacterized protein FPRO_03018 [Fusarium proliferatum ET1]CVK97041.1 uncharacterized protein FPRN_02897 [Fusarium proliferatum]CZR36722.1 uncharacterized protein FPRO_03018 [Fusarium proliferatum ET1]
MSGTPATTTAALGLMVLDVRTLSENNVYILSYEF